MKWKYGGAGVNVGRIGVIDGIKIDKFWVDVIVGVAVAAVILHPASMSPIMVDKRNIQM